MEIVKDIVASRALMVFSVFDKKALAYANPFYFHYKGEALRAIEDDISRGGNPLAMHPADFALYHIGDFDERSGVIKGCSPIEFVEEVSNCVTKAKAV